MKKILKTFLLICLFTMWLTVNIYGLPESDIKEAPVRNEDGYVGRIFDENFDKMYEDFERQVITDATSAGLWWCSNEGTSATLTGTSGYLHVNYKNGVGTNRSNPIYKAASGANFEGAYPYLVFVMKGTNNASVEDLILSFRYDDNHNEIEVDFTDLVDPDMSPMPELTDEYQVYIIDIMNSLDGLEYTADGETSISADSRMVGFHFLCKNDTTGTLDIKEVYYSKSVNTLGYENVPENSLIDYFHRENVNKPDGIYWCGSAGKIIGSHLQLTGNATYKSAGEGLNPSNKYKNLVLRVRGEVGGETLGLQTFSVADGEKFSDTIAYEDFKGPDGEKVPAIKEKFQNIVINFEKTGISNKIDGLKLITTEGTIYVDQMFFTNMEYNAGEIETEYPVLDSKDIIIWDSFNRENVGATPQYDGSNQVALSNGFAFIIAYAGIDRLSIDNGALVFDCTTDGGYIQYTSVSTANVNDGTYPYVVFKVKTTDGGSLSQFRINTICANDTRATVTWANGGLKSGNMLKAATEGQENYQYVTEDGYMYLIVDLAKSGLGIVPEGFDLYYSGSGKLYIDTIFFAKKGNLELDEEKEIVMDDFNRTTIDQCDNNWWFDTNATIEDGAMKMDFTSTGSWYRTATKQGFNNKDYNYPYMAITMKGSEGTKLNSFRFNLVSPDSEIVFQNTGKIILADGNALTESDITEDYKTFIIDLVKSGIADPAAEGICLRAGDWSNGIIYIDCIKFYGTKDVLAEVEEQIEELTKVVVIELSTPVISLTDNVLSIVEVQDAEEYEIYVDGVFKNKITSLTYNLDNFGLSQGSYKITVKAVRVGSEASDESNEVRYVVPSQKLAKPTATVKTDALTIEAVDGAEKYEIYVDGVKKTSTQELTYDLRSLNLKSGTYKITIIAVGNSVESSDVSDEINYVVKTSGCKSGSALLIFIGISVFGFTPIYFIKKSKSIY